MNASVYASASGVRLTSSQESNGAKATTTSTKAQTKYKFNVPGKYTLFADLQGGGKAQQVFVGHKDHSCDYTGTVTTPCGSETANLFGLTCTDDDPHVYGFPGAQGYKLDFGPLISSCSWQLTAFGFEIQVTAGGLPNYRSVLCEDLACLKVHFIDGDALGTGEGFKL